MGVAVIGVIAFLLGAWMIWRKKAPKLQVLMSFIAGLCIAGWIAVIVGWIVHIIESLSGKGGALLFGAGAAIVGFALAVIVILELVHAAHPKKGQPGKIHAPLALLAPGLIAAGGGIFTTVINGAQHAVGHLGTAVLALF